jgi:D-serine deaminase-like pyridoxal phosphate-dependent protein
MTRRKLLRKLAIAGAAAAGAALLRPRDEGSPYSPYFATKNALLRREGLGRPVLLIDLERLDANLTRVRQSLPPGKAFRVVTKSLPALGLLQRVMGAMATQRLMVFHQPHLLALATALPQADLLLGKPLPVAAAAGFYRELGRTTFVPAAQLQWLIDSQERLLQYRQLAATVGQKLRINLEIDVGLHRGGIADPRQLPALLSIIDGSSGLLELAGLMGYDAHVGKIPSVVESRATSLQKVCTRYRDFVQVLAGRLPAAQLAALTLNGAGSPTFRLHGTDSPLTELAAGSCLVKPTDFDLDLLADLEPAAFIAAPVLKALPGLALPGLSSLGPAWAAWDPNRRRTFFIYGGLWMAQPEAPAGLRDNPLYGRSTNQAILNGSTRVTLGVDDSVFFRPTQSEKVLLEFGDLLAVRGDAIEARWPVLPT